MKHTHLCPPYCPLLCFYASQHETHITYHPRSLSLYPNPTFVPLFFPPCQALVGYFDVVFDVEDYSLSFSTSPQDTPTHWKQTVFHFKDPIPVHTGMYLS